MDREEKGFRILNAPMTSEKILRGVPGPLAQTIRPELQRYEAELRADQ